MLPIQYNSSCSRRSELRLLLRLIVIDLLFIGVLSRPATAAVPQFGAQVWIEPGQTPEQIDGWFATLEQGHMPVARLFLMWSYLEPTANGWDWSLYDAAFHSAERHHVAIVAQAALGDGAARRQQYLERRPADGAYRG